MRHRTGWIIGIIIGVIALLVLPGLFGRYGMMSEYGTGYGMGGYGMMGGGRWFPFMFLGWLIPAGIIVLVIAGGIWLGNTLSGKTGTPPATPTAPPAMPAARTCTSCGKPLAADWKVCPYCGTEQDQA